MPGASAPGAAVPPPPGAPAPGTVAPGAVAPGTSTPVAQSSTLPADDDIEVKKPAWRDRSLRLRLLMPVTRRQNLGVAAVLLIALIVAAAIAVVVARWLVGVEAVDNFLTRYPGQYELPENAPVGLPAWLGWQHFFNMFFLFLIIRTGIQVNRERRPKGYWTSKRGGKKISLTLWIHLTLDALWVFNGALFYILLFATGQWMRIVPTSWEVFPNAVSAGLQYVSLNWPTENSWVNYNSLQQLTYFITVFIAAPLAIITGLRLSQYWPKGNKALNRLLPIGVARGLHFPVMIYFVVFTIIHVLLVFATGALRNLNHMYAAQDTTNWTGFWLFVLSLVVIVAAVIAIRPSLVAPLARRFGDVTAR